MTDYVTPSGARIADADRVRLGAYLAEGTTIMHEGFVKFNAGTLGESIVEGCITAPHYRRFDLDRHCEPYDAERRSKKDATIRRLWPGARYSSLKATMISTNSSRENVRNL